MSEISKALKNVQPQYEMEQGYVITHPNISDLADITPCIVI